MAEAAASEKGVSAHQEVRDLLLFPNHVKMHALRVLLSLSYRDMLTTHNNPIRSNHHSVVPAFVSFRTQPSQTGKLQLNPLFQGSISFAR